MLSERPRIDETARSDFTSAGMALYQPFYGIDGMLHMPERDSRWQVSTAKMLRNASAGQYTYDTLRTRVSNWQSGSRPVQSWVWPVMVDELQSSATDFLTMADLTFNPDASSLAAPLFGFGWQGYLAILLDKPDNYFKCMMNGQLSLDDKVVVDVELRRRAKMMVYVAKKIEWRA
jgi:hypothetical protein